MDRYSRILCTTLIVLGSFVSGVLPLAAQTPESSTTFVSEITGATIDIGNSGMWEIVDTDFHPADGDTSAREVIQVFSDESFFAIQIMDSHFTPDSWYEASIGRQKFNYNQAEILGYYGNSSESWSLIRGAPVLNFIRIGYNQFYTDETTGISLSVEVHSNESAFLSEMESIRSNITLDGEYAFANANMQEIEAMLNGTSTIEPIPMPFEYSSVADWQDFGLVSETEWDSDKFNTSVTWDDNALEFPFHRKVGITHESDDQTETLRLLTPDFTGHVDVTLANNAEGRNLDDWLARWESEEFLSQSIYQYPSIDHRKNQDTIGIVFTRDAGFGNQVVTIRHAVFTTNGDLAYIDIEATPTDISKVYEDISRAIVINNEPLVSLWSVKDIEEMFPPGATSSAQDADTAITRTLRTAASAESSASNNTVTGEATGVVIDLGPSGHAIFQEDGHNVVESDSYTLETFKVDYGNTIVVIDVMDGDVSVSQYMLTAETDIASTFDYMDWLGGDWSDSHAWDVYSGAYKLDYRELVYVELVQDPDSGLYFGIGVYGSEADLANDISWLQSNITIDSKGILSNADPDAVTSVIEGASDFIPEPVPMAESTVTDWSDAGLVSETEWQSPFTNTSFIWDGEEFVFPFAQNDAISASDGITTLELRTADRRGEVKLTTAETDDTPADWVEMLTSTEYLDSQEALGQPLTILDSFVSDETASVITLFYTAFDHPVVAIFDVYVNASGVTIITEISAAPEDIAGVYAAFWNSVQSDGDYYPLTWTVEDIESLDVQSAVRHRKE